VWDGRLKRLLDSGELREQGLDGARQFVLHKASLEAEYTSDGPEGKELLWIAFLTRHFNHIERSPQVEGLGLQV